MKFSYFWLIPVGVIIACASILLIDTNDGDGNFKGGFQQQIPTSSTRAEIPSWVSENCYPALSLNNTAYEICYEGGD